MGNGIITVFKLEYANNYACMIHKQSNLACWETSRLHNQMVEFLQKQDLIIYEICMLNL
jgi:hypothetical protein